tara:strand:+ start:543 stop:1187 length:645 start_codon:yes stop_codon:yes gene_type:complete
MKNLFNIDNAFKVLVVLLLSVMAFGANAASLGGSIGYGNDYIFRGQTQTQGSGFAFGSIDLDLENGAYVGVWVGEVDFAGGNADAEIDMYAGYQTELSDGVSVGVQYTDYSYSGDSSLDGSEYTVSGSFGDLTLSHTIGQDDYLDYSLVSYNLMDFVDVSYGTLDTVGDHYTISKSFELPLGLDAVASYVDFTADSGSNAVDEDAFVVRVSKSF